MANEDIKKYSLEELRAMRQSGQSQTQEDAPEYDVDESFWENAQITMPSKKKSVHLRLDEEVLAYFQGQGKGHISRMQAVLKAYAEAHQKQHSERLR